MSIFLALLTIHFVADFLLQTDWMALNKSKNWGALAIHAFVYAGMFLPFFSPLFFIVTFLTHFVTDAITSRITSFLWFIDFLSKPSDAEDGRFVGKMNAKRHWFFVMIGFDQLIHAYTLVYTWWFLVGRYHA